MGEKICLLVFFLKFILRNNWTFLFIHSDIQTSTDLIYKLSLHFRETLLTHPKNRAKMDIEVRPFLWVPHTQFWVGWEKKPPKTTPNHKTPMLLLWCFTELKRWKYNWRSKSHGATNTVSVRDIKTLAAGNNTWKNHDFHRCRNKSCCLSSAAVSWG